MKCLLALIAVLFLAVPATALAQIRVEPWYIHEGNENKDGKEISAAGKPLPKGIIAVPVSNPEEMKKAFEKAQIPTDGWIKVPLESNGTIRFSPGSSITQPKQQVDFTYFKTAVTVPAGGVTEFKITFGTVDDAARIYVNGEPVPEADIIGRKNSFKTIDLKNKIKEGKNEIVVVQYDNHPPGNTLEGLALEVNGEAISAAGNSLTITPWQVNEGNDGLIDFQTRTDEQRTEALSKGTIPAKDAEGWNPAEIRKDGSVVFQKRSEVKKIAGQLDFAYFQATVIVPAGGVKKFEVKYDLVDDGARIYLFNSKYPDGFHIPATDVIKIQHKLVTADFTEQAVEGENRVVVVKFDQAAPGNSLMGLRLTVSD